MKAIKNSLKEYASETSLTKWETINWDAIESKVTALQVRIVKAYKAKQFRKVRSLQWTLTRSYAAKLLAVKRVTSNRGRRTPGVDGAVWMTDNSKMKAVQSLNRKSYRPLPLRRIYIPKANGKQRPLSIPAMKDRAMQALYLLALDPIAETRADNNSYGFRPKRSCADAIQQCYSALFDKRAAQWVLDADIAGCFDNISHEWLHENIPMDKRILRLWLKAKIIDGKSFFQSENGTPQGGIISPVLANMVLDGLETVLNTIARKRYSRDGVVKKNLHLVNYVRYADNFIVTARSKDFLKEKIIPAIEEFLRCRGLSLSEEKTRIVNINEGFDFLGQHVRKYKGKLLIKPSKKNIKSFKEKVSAIISKNKTTSQAVLIKQLNPVIRGWTNYHRCVAASQTFNKIDHFIFYRLWSWARRRHSNKSASWVMKRYFHTVENFQWALCCMKTPATLRRAQSTSIKRHIKVRGLANPYDPLWFTYFEQRAITLRTPRGQLKQSTV